MAEPSKSTAPSGATTPDRRRETRWPASETSTLTIQTSGREVEVRMVDISDAGLRICLNEQLKEGERVRVKFRDLEAFGEVRWCRQLHLPCHESGIEIAILV